MFAQCVCSCFHCAPLASWLLCGTRKGMKITTHALMCGFDIDTIILKACRKYMCKQHCL